MVLERPVIAGNVARLWAVVAIALLWGGCIKGRPTRKLQQETPIAVAVVHDLDGAVAPAPESLTSEIQEALAARNLIVQPIARSVFETEFARKRATRDRFQSVTARAGRTQIALLVETRAQYFAQILGQFRWTVYVKLTLGKEGEAEASSTSSFSVPVMLMYNHQGETEALAYASHTIADKVGKEIDDYVAGLEFATLSPRSSSAKASELGPMYFVMVDRFHNGRVDNDGDIDPGDPQAFHGGDIAGIIEKLDHIASMGFRTIWLSPIFSMRTEKIGEHGAFHGYWTEDLKEAEKRFGTTEELVALRDELDKRGMNLVLDMVLNHVGYDTKLVSEHPEWFHQNGDIENWEDPVQSTTFDVHGLPDLAQEKAAVYDYLLSASVQWIEALQPAGFRLDAVKHVGNDFWHRYTKALGEVGGTHFATIGELYDGDAKVIANGFKEGGFSHLFDFPLYFSMKDTFCEGKHLGRLAATLSLDRFYPNAERLMTFADNHDLPRLWSACQGDVDRVRALLTFMLTARGIPTVSYGTEVGLAGNGEPENRRDMDFDEDNQFVSLIGALLEARRSHPVLRHGENRPLHLSKEHYAYLRVGPKEVALILSNTGATSWTFESPFMETARGVSLLGGEGVADSATVPARSVNVFIYKTVDVVLPERITKSVSLEASADAHELLLVGAAPEFGSWDPARALEGTRRSDGSFVFDVEVMNDAVEVFKLVRRVGDTYEWEEGGNRYLYAGTIAGETLLPVFASGEMK